MCLLLLAIQNTNSRPFAGFALVDDVVLLEEPVIAFAFSIQPVHYL